MSDDTLPPSTTDQRIGWTCVRCGRHVTGPYAECNKCGHKPERKSSSTDRIPPISLQSITQWANIVITLYRLTSVLGFNLHEEVERRMSIDRIRDQGQI